MRPKSNFIQISTGPIVPVMWPFAPATFESQAGTLIRSIVSRRCIKPSLFLTKKKNKEKKEIHNNVTKSAARIIELHGQYHRQSLIFPFAFHRPPSWSLFVNYMLINWSVGGCFVPHWHIRVATFFLAPLCSRNGHQNEVMFSVHCQKSFGLFAWPHDVFSWQLISLPANFTMFWMKCFKDG